jgi:dihydroorotate dehydrogenase
MPQPGNPRPRVFRLPEDEAVINRMGFPSQGMSKVERRLWDFSNPSRPVIIGVNLGKNKDTPLEESAKDYIDLMWQFMLRADYLTLNISSPNTMGLRRLQGREMLENMLGEVAKARKEIALEKFGYAPVLVKLAPDLSEEELDDAIGIILDKGMDGIIATNTTLAREGLRSRLREESGGLSGSPLRERSEAVLRQVVKRVNGRIPIVSVGGIMNPDDARRRLELGATLIQLYTGLVYRGPGLVKEILPQ